LTVNWNRQNFGGEDPEKHPAIEVLRRDFASDILESAGSCGEVWAVIKPSAAVKALTMLRDDPALHYDFLSDLTAVHWPERKGSEFEVVYQLYSISHHTRFRVKVPLADGESVPTASGIWMTANWLEREVYDMFGIRFEGHPDLRRILNPDGFEGYPLRKEFPLQGRVRW
jgi:NADH-quinone oxidoreductase subunit C